MEITLIAKVIKRSVDTLAELNMKYLEPYKHFLNKDMKNRHDWWVSIEIQQ